MNELTREFMERPARLRREIQDQKEKILEINLSALPRMRAYDAPLVQGSYQGDRIERLVQAKIKAEDKLEELLEERREALDQIRGLLDDLQAAGEITPEERDVLALRYIKRRSFSWIAEKAGRSQATIFRRHRSGIEAIEARLDEYPRENVEN